MMQTIVPFEIRNRHGDGIFGDVHLPEVVQNAPVLIFCHGTRSHKSWGFIPFLSARISESGYIVVRFNFSLNGMKEHGVTFEDVEALRSNTYSHELDDLQDVMDAVRERCIVPVEAAADRIVLAGHSRGASIAILTAAVDARVQALATISAVATFDRWGRRTREQWKRQGVLWMTAGEAGMKLPLGVDLLHDLETNRERLDILRAASRVEVPWLIIHGEQDLSVSVQEARQLHRASSNPASELQVIPHADHVFGADDPLTEPSPVLTDLSTKMVEWLGSNVRPSARDDEGSPVYS